MSRDSSTSPVLILCPTRFEAERLQRAGLSAVHEIITVGPGATGIERWTRGSAGDERPVVLAGLAGGLTARVQVGDACVIDAVVCATGVRLEPTLALRSRESLRATVSCPVHSLTTPVDKRAWRQMHDSDLVDLESEMFARAMSEAGRRWAVVRGVSDGPDDTLPDDIDHWVDVAGRVRIGYVAVRLARCPWLCAEARRLGANAARAMNSVADLLRSATIAP